MTDLQQRIDNLRRAIADLQAGINTGRSLSDLERQARDLLADAKNTPYENAAQTLFGDVARLSASSGSGVAASSTATIRGLTRRARIRIEIAGDEDDIDEAIDILAEALALNPTEPEVIDLLNMAAARNDQANHRVQDLYKRYNVIRSSEAPTNPSSGSGYSGTGTYTPPITPYTSTSKPTTQPSRRTSTEMPAVPPATPPTSAPPPAPPRFPTSAGYPAPEQQPAPLPSRPSDRRRSTQQTPLYAGDPDVDDLLSDLTQSYYAGDYQLTVETANRILMVQPGNPTALEYRQKAEDNIIRGVVPDHRIPFDARVSYNRAKSLERAGNYEDAERLYREARDLAERTGILSWKDAEQALLDIQDLALAREMLSEGDRLLATDNWGEALRKYEGALRVVPNDPQAEERIEVIRRVQHDTDQAAVQISMLSGTLSEQAAQLRNVLSILTRVRQLLPNSQRIAQLQQDANARLTGIKTQIIDQAQAAINRANNAVSIDERLSLSAEGLRILDLGVDLDPSDTRIADLTMQARGMTGEMQRARQVMERAASLIAQNFDQEITQARTMLTGLREFAQDERYRNVVNDLLSRYMERAEIALEDGDMSEAQNWLDTMREEPFRMLGRRAEVQRLENMIRRKRRDVRLQIGVILLGIVLILGAVAFFTRDSWYNPLMNTLFPPPTNTPTITPTPTETFTPSMTPTASYTPTDTATFTATYTPSYTPTWTPTPTDTPTFTPTYTPSNTPTFTATFTPSNTPTATLTPSITPTPEVICYVIAYVQDGLFVRSRPSTNLPRLGVVPFNTVMAVTQQALGIDDNLSWYYVRVAFDDAEVVGWVRSDVTRPSPGSTCPILPG